MLEDVETNDNRQTSGQRKKILTSTPPVFLHGNVPSRMVTEKVQYIWTGLCDGRTWHASGKYSQ